MAVKWVSKDLFVSSGEVYGQGAEGKMHLTDTAAVDNTNKRACYPNSKRAAESLVSYTAQYNIDTVIAGHATSKDQL